MPPPIPISHRQSPSRFVHVPVNLVRAPDGRQPVISDKTISGRPITPTAAPATNESGAATLPIGRNHGGNNLVALVNHHESVNAAPRTTEAAIETPQHPSRVGAEYNGARPGNDPRRCWAADRLACRSGGPAAGRGPAGPSAAPEWSAVTLPEPSETPAALFLGGERV